MAKNIVVCCDGTGNEYGANNTNVVKLYEAIVRDRDQAAFYDPGVGTFSFLGRTLGRRVGRTLGKAFGAGLQQNIEDAYRFLMDRYEPGDRLYLFGFSRGALTTSSAGVEEMGYLPVTQSGAILFFQLVNRLYGRASTVLTSNKGFEEWGRMGGSRSVTFSMPGSVTFSMSIDKAVCAPL